MKNDFLDTMRSQVLVADGAMGSMIARSLPREAPAAMANSMLAVNLAHPEVVHSIHLAYIAAGARVIITNTFGVSRARLEKLGLGDDAQRVVSDAVKIAREARDSSGKSVWIAGSISPLDADWLLDTDPSAAQQRRQFQEQAELLLDRGVDLIILETFSRLDELLLAIDAVREVSASAALIASMSFDEHGELASGEDAESAGQVQVVGVNCSLGPQASVAVLESLSRGVTLPMSIMPNAGFAQRIGGRVLYPDMSRQYYEDFARDALELRAQLIGGCCGTTPEQIRVIQESVETLGRQDAVRIAPTRARAELVDEELPHMATERPSGLTSKLLSGDFVRSLQIDPQRGPSDTLNREVVQSILEHRMIDLVDINSSGGSARQDSMQIAAGIEQLGVETLPHITPRDGSVAGVLAQVLGAYDWGGVRNFLVVAGDPPKGDLYAEAKGVYQVDSVGLVRSLARLRAGRRVKERVTMPPFHMGIGVALNQNAPHVGAELLRLQDKIQAGADFAMTQPFFDVEDWYRFREQLDRRFDIPVILGVWPLISAKQARRVNENVAGVVIPKSVCKKLEDAGPNEREVGFALAAKLIATLEREKTAAGVYVVAPFKQPKQALEVFERAAALSCRSRSLRLRHEQHRTAPPRPGTARRVRKACTPACASRVQKSRRVRFPNTCDWTDVHIVAGSSLGSGPSAHQTAR
jgi:homocysteine S-methyltransferase